MGIRVVKIHVHSFADLSLGRCQPETKKKLNPKPCEVLDKQRLGPGGKGRQKVVERSVLLGVRRECGNIEIYTL